MTYNFNEKQAEFIADVLEKYAAERSDDKGCAQRAGDIADYLRSKTGGKTQRMSEGDWTYIALTQGNIVNNAVYG